MIRSVLAEHWRPAGLCFWGMNCSLWTESWVFLLTSSLLVFLLGFSTTETCSCASPTTATATMKRRSWRKRSSPLPDISLFLQKRSFPHKSSPLWDNKQLFCDLTSSWRSQGPTSAGHHGCHGAGLKQEVASALRALRDKLLAEQKEEVKEAQMIRATVGLCVFVCPCVCLCLYVCPPVSICVFLHLCVFVDLCVYFFFPVCDTVCVCVFRVSCMCCCICIFLRLCVSASVCFYLCVFLSCMFLCVVCRRQQLRVWAWTSGVFRSSGAIAAAAVQPESSSAAGSSRLVQTPVHFLHNQHYTTGAKRVCLVLINKTGVQIKLIVPHEHQHWHMYKHPKPLTSSWGFWTRKQEVGRSLLTPPISPVTRRDKVEFGSAHCRVWKCECSMQSSKLKILKLIAKRGKEAEVYPNINM